MIKTVIFDLGNVLVLFDHKKMVEQIAEACEIPFDDVYEAVVERNLGIAYERGEMSTQEVYDFFRKISNKKEEELNDEILFQAIGDIFQMNKPMDQLVMKLKNNGLRLILLSNTSEIHFEVIKTNYEVVQHFEHVVLSFEVKARKPEEVIFRSALEKFENKPEECLFIDDIAEYTEAAKRLGMDAIHFKGYEDLVEQLRKRKLLE